jgi:hypothetical protein
MSSQVASGQRYLQVLQQILLKSLAGSGWVDLASDDSTNLLLLMMFVSRLCLWLVGVYPGPWGRRALHSRSC